MSLTHPSPDVSSKLICNTCRSMTTTHKGLSALLSARGFKYVYAEVEQNIDKGCVFCKTMIQLLLRNAPPVGSRNIYCTIPNLMYDYESVASDPESDFWYRYSLQKHDDFRPELRVQTANEFGQLDLYALEGKCYHLLHSFCFQCYSGLCTSDSGS